MHINHLELKPVFLEFQTFCCNKTVLIAINNTTVVAYSNKEWGMKSGSLCALLWRILSWCTRNQVTLRARHISGRLIADKLFRLSQTIQTEWSLHPKVFQAICSRWHQPQLDLFATRFSNKVPQFVSPVPEPQAWAVDTLSLSWEGLDPYAFPPAAILGKMVEKLQDPCPLQQANPYCTGMAQHALVLGSGGHVQSDSTVSAQHTQLGISTIQPGSSQESTNLNPHAWFLEPQLSRSKSSLRQWQHELKLLKEDQLDQSMRQSGPILQRGASVIRWTSGHHL